MQDLLCLVLTVVIGVAWGQNADGAWNVGAYPDPILYPGACGRDEPSFVCDPGNHLPIAKANFIDGLLKSIYNETNSGCYTTRPERIGYLIMLAVVPKMEKYFTRKLDDNMAARFKEAVSFSYFLSQPMKWGNHSVNCNEMAVMIYAVEEGVLFTMTLPKIKEVLTNEKLMDITWEALFRFQPIRQSPARGADAISLMARKYKMILKENRAQG